MGMAAAVMDVRLECPFWWVLGAVTDGAPLPVENASCDDDDRAAWQEWAVGTSAVPPRLIGNGEEGKRESTPFLPVGCSVGVGACRPADRFFSCGVREGRRVGLPLFGDAFVLFVRLPR